MGLVQLLMPKMGESVMEGTILSWLKQPGDSIAQDESVLEVATDKVDTEVPAPFAGVLHEILAQKGQTVAVGQAIALIQTNSSEDSIAPKIELNKTLPQVEVVKPQIQQQSKVQPTEGPISTSNRFYSPLVLSIAREEQIPLAELESVPGTGQNGRLTKHDLFAYLERRKTVGNNEKVVEEVNEVVTPEVKEQRVVTQEPIAKAKPAARSVNGASELIEMDRMRKIIAERMIDSRRISAHVTSFVEADVTNIVYWRNRLKNEFMDKEGVALTFTPIFIEAVVKAIKDYPMVNISVEGDFIRIHKEINIGMAVALPDGNLIVPVIRNADQLNLIGLTKKVNDLARRARAGTLTPDDLTGGTYTISNVGSFGNLMGTPILVQPQCGILALGAVVKKPCVIETAQGDTIGIRHMMFLSHSYDHRVIDGSLGGMFVRRVADFLEGFDANRKMRD
jgi:2-oxoglutarate dehydrogenase E2 component (dihydrolipoamide succinyltransferase)